VVIIQSDHAKNSVIHKSKNVVLSLIALEGSQEFVLPVPQNQKKKIDWQSV